MTPVTYPRLIRRIKAVAFDSVFIPLAMFGGLFLGEGLGFNGYLKATLFFVPLVLFEPFLVSTTGGSLGHHLFGLKVTQLDGQSKVNFFVAALRTAVRVVLGAFSLIFVLTSRKHQAIHDVIFRTLVVNKNPEQLAEFEVLAEREESPSGFVQKSALRRGVVISIYCLLVVVAVGLGFSMLVSGQCLKYEICTSGEKGIERAMNIPLLLGLGVCIVQGWRGRLLGCRRVANNP